MKEKNYSINAVLEQRSPEWHKARLGKVGGSEATGYATPAKLKTLVINKVTELVTGSAPAFFVNDAMQRGIDNEERVVLDYEMNNDIEVSEAGQITNKLYKYAALSPDGLIYEGMNIVGAVEVKCPNSSTHLGTILGKRIPVKNIDQVIHYFMIIDDLQWLDFLSWDDRSIGMEDCKFRITREENKSAIDKAIANYKKFEEKMDETLEQLELV